MNMKNAVWSLLAAAACCGTLAGCSSAPAEPEVSEEPVTEAPAVQETEAETEPETEPIVFEEQFHAEPGQAYLAIVDGQYWIQYWGKDNDAGAMLSYNAGIADIKGNGTYTVSVDADTVGFRYEATQDPFSDYVPGGLNFLAVMIPEGENLYPGAVLTVESIKVDGQEIELLAKNYTSSDDKVETRTNLYNAYIDAPSSDARSEEGPLFEDEEPLDICAAYSPQVVDPAAFASWKKVEVTFTISGIEDAAPADEAGEDGGVDMPDEPPAPEPRAVG